MPCKETEGELHVIIHDWSVVSKSQGTPKIANKAPEARTRQGRIHRQVSEGV